MEFVMAKTEHANLDIRVFDKSNPNGICAHLRDLWGNKKHPERFSLASLSLSRVAEWPRLRTNLPTGACGEGCYPE
mgnify:CR=1 FL=1